MTSFDLVIRNGIVVTAADIMHQSVTITNAMLHHNVDYTPYEGMKITGYPETMTEQQRAAALVETTSTSALTGAAFDLSQSIFHCDSAATPAAPAEFSPSAPGLASCRGPRLGLALLGRPHCYEHPNSCGQPESADRLP